MEGTTNQVQKNREKVASVIGAQLANEFADDQLPAILHAIDGDEHEVRLAAQQIARSRDVENPAALIMWTLRERKRTNLLPAPSYEPQRTPLPPLPGADELARRKAISAEWKRIQGACRRSQDFLTLYQEYQRLHPNASHEVAASIRAELIEVLDEMNSQKEART